MHTESFLNYVEYFYICGSIIEKSITIGASALSILKSYVKKYYITLSHTPKRSKYANIHVSSLMI